MTPRKLTAVLSVALLVSLIAYDIVVYLAYGPPATWSMVWMGFLTDHPWVTFALGFISGHVVWPTVRRVG